MADPNLTLLEIAAEKLEALLQEVVFLCGATLGLLIPDAAAAPVRPTIDVDLIAEIASYVEYVAFSERLKALGFSEDQRPGAPICRWIHGELIVDVMPTEASALGFGNPWYLRAFESAQHVELPSGRCIRTVTPVFFLGTKIEAFRGRGYRDFLASRDLEDFISIVDAREFIAEEIQAASDEVRHYLALAARELLAEPQFLSALPGYLLPDDISQQRLPELLRKLQIISQG